MVPTTPKLQFFTIRTKDWSRVTPDNSGQHLGIACQRHAGA
jgi:hypothetical protein